MSFSQAGRHKDGQDVISNEAYETREEAIQAAQNMDIDFCCGLR